MTLRAALLLLALPLAGCDFLPAGQTPVRADYAPEEAGTVDHALCLLGFTGVPLRELASGHHTVDVVLNGRPATFVLDTGANATVLHAPYAEEFGVGRGIPGGAVGLGGAMRAQSVSIESFAIGAVDVRIGRIMTTDLSQLTTMLGPMAGGRVHGIVGQDAMKEHRAVIDVRRSIVHLIEENRDPVPVSPEACRPDGAAPDGSADRPEAAARP
jgi:hypothetical protein